MYSTDGNLDPSHKVRKQYDVVRGTIAERGEGERERGTVGH